MDKQCVKCLYHETKGDSDASPLVECKRYPPVITDKEMFESSFPWVEKTNHCGEFKW